MICPLCQTKGRHQFNQILMGKYDVKYYQCPNCYLLYTEKPYWLGEAYEKAIANIDTGIITRNIEISVKVERILRWMKINRKVCLDYGGGYGIFVRIMRDLGYNFLWYDKYAENLLASGFEWNKKEKIEVLTAFELFEHFENPAKEIEILLSISKRIIFSTECYSEEGILRDKDWWYYAVASGQHIVFYSTKTLKYIADKYGIYYYHILGLHYFTDEPLKNWNMLCLKIADVFGKIPIRWWVKIKHSKAIDDFNFICKKYEE